MTRRVAILIFDDVEVLDFCGPLEVFGVASEVTENRPFEVYTVSAAAEPVLARQKLSVNASYSFANCPPPDILLVPGGVGTRKLVHDAAMIDWIKTQAQSVELLLSVCTGALLLAKAGLLNGLAATTHHVAYDLLQQLEPNLELRAGDRFVDNGQIITSAGVSAGIDMSLYVVGKLLGSAAVAATVEEMEYTWQPDQQFKTA